MRHVPNLVAAFALVAAAPELLLAQGKPAAAPVRPVTAGQLVGRWGDNGDCAKDVVFRSDGTFSSYTGGGGRWSLNGDRLVLSGEGGTFPMVVRWGGPNQLIITNPDGSVGTSQRC